jgi:thiamine biosynthesis lipoprotein
MSLYRKGSLIQQFNSENASSIQMDPHMKKVVEESFRINELSKGYFDITVFPLVELWGFGPNGFTNVPDDHQIDSVRQVIGMDKLRLDGDRLYKTDPRVKIDLDGIAQGYTVDFLSEYLSRKGITDYIVEIGGEIRTKGQKPEGDFKIMLDEVNDLDPKYSKPVLTLRDMAITTSSIRERNYKLGEETFSHHIDPRLGTPIQNTTVSVTVIAETAMRADALDNYLMSLDPQEAIAFVETLPAVDVCVYFATDKGIKVLCSSGFNNYLYN